MMKDLDYAFLVMHNHPSDSSFSKKDIKTFSDTELQKLEDYIMENFIDLDVPEEIKKKFLALKKQEEKNT